MGDIEQIASMLIGKVEQYGALFNSKVFPLFVQRQVMWGHVNRTLGWVAIGLFVLSIVLAVLGSIKEDKFERDNCGVFYGPAVTLFFISIPMAVICFIMSAVKLGSPEYSAIMALIQLLGK